jgi:hypothetical protein
MGETAMGVTEKRKNGTGNYLLLHRSGAVAHTKTLTTTEPVDGITTIINLETLEQYNGEQWEKIPVGYATLIEAEADDESDDEYDDGDDASSYGALQLGARRCFNPHVVWAYAKANFRD